MMMVSSFKWAYDPYPIQKQAILILLKGHLRFDEPFGKFDGPMNPCIYFKAKLTQDLDIFCRAWQ